MRPRVKHDNTKVNKRNAQSNMRKRYLQSNYKINCSICMHLMYRTLASSAVEAANSIKAPVHNSQDGT